MAVNQLTIPGMPPPSPPKPKKLSSLAQLKDRVLKLELEVTLVRILLEKGARDHT